MPTHPPGAPDHARFGDRVATGVVEVRHGRDAVSGLDQAGFWVVVATFEGEVTAVRFERVDEASPEVVPEATSPGGAAWAPLDGEWTTSLDHAAYVRAVEQTRERIAAGEVYQANICRVLRHPLAQEADLDDLAHLLRARHRAPYASRIRVVSAGLDVVSASPELFLRRAGRRLVSSPIKGTATVAEAMLSKDHAENVMIVDLVRNDFSRVCEPGSVDVEALCRPQEHPGLVHLVSTVSGRLSAEVGWAQILAATFPPASVSGTPKSSALRVIRDLEPVPRGPYCGAIGWVDADRGEAELAVGIRTFWVEDDERGRDLCFGTGAGLTWGSDPQGEWAETQLKADTLVGLASGLSPVTG
ncbi:chorismate-binding protein [Dermatophilaceae bacterium Soc4.6]